MDEVFVEISGELREKILAKEAQILEELNRLEQYERIDWKVYHEYYDRLKGAGYFPYYTINWYNTRSNDTLKKLRQLRSLCQDVREYDGLSAPLSRIKYICNLEEKSATQSVEDYEQSLREIYEMQLDSAIKIKQKDDKEKQVDAQKQKVTNWIWFASLLVFTTILLYNL